MKYYQPPRASGRTTRMLKAAVDECWAGNHVRVLGADTQHVGVLAAQLKHLVPAGLWEHFETNSHGSVHFRHPERGSIFIQHTLGTVWNWHTMEFQTWRGRQEEKVFVDHHAIEKHFGRMLDELARWEDATWEPPAACDDCGQVVCKCEDEGRV